MNTPPPRLFRRMRRGLLAALATCVLGWVLPASAQERLRVGIVPQFPAEEIDASWTPILRMVSERTGIALELVHYKSITAFEAAFATGDADLLYLNPYHVIMAKRVGYEPIVRDTNEKLSGILVVRKDARFERLEQLNGATIAFPAPNAFGASLYMRALLTREAKLSFAPIYRGTHSNVFRHVIAGQADAGGAILSTLEREEPEIRNQLRILFETPATPAHPLALHKRVPGATRDKLQKAFIALAQHPQGHALLQEVRLATPVTSAYADYESLERLNLQEFADDK